MLKKYKNFIQYVLKHRIISFIIFLLFLVAFPPLLTNILFSIYLPFNILHANWTEGDHLLFLATMISAAVATFGIILSIWKGQEMLEVEYRTNVMPFFVLESLDQIFIDSFNEIGNLNKNKEKKEIRNEYKQFKLSKYFIVINSNEISYKSILSGDMKHIVERNSLYWKKVGSDYSFVKENIGSILFQITNLGNGNAVHLRWGVNSDKVNQKERKYLTPIAIKKYDKIFVHFIIEFDEKLIGNLYQLELIFNDIYGNQYEQVFKIEILRNNENQDIVRVEMTSIPSLIKFKKVFSAESAHID